MAPNSTPCADGAIHFSVLWSMSLFEAHPRLTTGGTAGDAMRLVPPGMTKPESLSRCYRTTALGILELCLLPFLGEKARENSDSATRSRNPSHPPATRHVTPPNTPPGILAYPRLCVGK